MRVRRKRCLRIVALVLAFACAHGAAAHGTPSTPEIEAKQAALAEAQATLAGMNDELEVRIEEYNAINEALDGTRASIAETRVTLERAEDDLAAAELLLSDRATSIYKDGGSGLLDVIVGAHTFRDFMVRIDLAMRITRADAQVVADVKAAKADVEATKRTLEQREAEQSALAQEAATRADLIEADIARQEGFVASLDEEVKTLIAEEEERQRLLAEERARQAAALAAQYASTARPSAEASELGAGHPEIVGIALQFLGVPYVYGGASPEGFDCSGLTSYCYEQIGIDLPRTSRSQYGVGLHIAPDRLDLLLPGDLVFFATDANPALVHHVGIYVGNGNYVHAPQTGDVVKVSSLTERIARRGDYVGASRLP